LRCLLSYMVLPSNLELLDSLILHGQIRMLREVMLFHLERFITTNDPSTYAVNEQCLCRQLVLAIAQGSEAIVGVLLQHRRRECCEYRKDSSPNAWAILAIQSTNMAIVELVVNYFTTHSQQSNSVSPGKVRFIQWPRILYSATTSNTLDFIQARAAADGYPLTSTDWFAALHCVITTSKTWDGLHQVVHLHARRIERLRTDYEHFGMSWLIQELFGSGIELEEAEWLQRLIATHELCRVIDFDQYWKMTINCIARMRNPIAILELAFYAGLMMREHASYCSGEFAEMLLTSFDAFQAKQIARRMELDLATDLPRVLGDIVIAY
jgi:hypothetical protein